MLDERAAEPVVPVLRVSEPVVLRDLPEVLPVDAEPAARAEVTTSFQQDPTERIPLVSAPGKRKAVKHAGSRGPLFRGLPSAPVLVGIAALAVSAGGAVLAGGGQLTDGEPPRLAQASVLGGASGDGRVELPQSERRAVISRDSRRDALESAADKELKAAVEKEYVAHTGELQNLAAAAEKRAADIEENLWVLPLSGYHLTARFGQYGLWSSYHTGLDFAAPTGTPINAVASGTVTETGYDGAYGNKTVVTLADGTEIWFCHQTTIDVSVGDVVAAGDHLGTVGSTGNVTGPHLHLEVRPGGGDPVDPYSALVVNGVTP
jgi:murein DD-endopeptidase MepM/ murein hydrolase activator NlpD